MKRHLIGCYYEPISDTHDHHIPPPNPTSHKHTHTHTHTHFKKERNIPGMKSQPVVVNFWE